MFFADGDFQTYRTYGANPSRSAATWRGFVTPWRTAPRPIHPIRTGPSCKSRERRVLARTEHILVPPPATANPDDPLGMGKFTDSQWRDWMSNTEYDAISLRGWELIPPARRWIFCPSSGTWRSGWADKLTSKKNVTAGGVTLDPAKPESLHAFMCRGVGQFEIQGWSDAEQRWIPRSIRMGMRA